VVVARLVIGAKVLLVKVVIANGKAKCFINLPLNNGISIKKKVAEIPLLKS
jgi:hypothetical protein